MRLKTLYVQGFIKYVCFSPIFHIGEVPGGTRGYLKSMGFLHQNLLNELRRTKKAVAEEQVESEADDEIEALVEQALDHPFLLVVEDGASEEINTEEEAEIREDEAGKEINIVEESDAAGKTVIAQALDALWQSGALDDDKAEDEVSKTLTEDLIEETNIEESGVMPGRTPSTMNRLKEFQDLGMGQRSFGYVSPYSRRKNGVTARTQASQENREKQKEYNLTGKECIKCKKMLRNGSKVKSKILRCTSCLGFVHENNKNCKINLQRGNTDDFSCELCHQEREEGERDS